jgi:hypothetical protein
MRKIMLLGTLLFMITVVGGMRIARAQDRPKQSSEATEESVDAYRLDIAFNELEDGKKMNTRQYSIDLAGKKPNEIKIGTRVPVVTANCNSSSASSSSGGASEQYQYLDLGTHVWAQVTGQPGDELHVTGDISSVDTSAGLEGSTRLGPVIRQIKIEGSTALVLGKPIIIGSADDPNSKRQFQLEVTVTKLK